MTRFTTLVPWLLTAAVGLTLAPGAAMAEHCAWDGFNFPGARATKAATLKEVFRAVAPNDAVPSGDAAIAKALCWEESCLDTLPAVVEGDIMQHLVAPAPGGGYWVFRELDFSEFGQCSNGMVEVAERQGRFLLLKSHIEWGERVYCEDDETEEECPGPACAWAGDEYKHWLLDLEGGQLLATAGCGGYDETASWKEGPDAPKVDVSDGQHLKYVGCGRHLALTLAEIRGCARANATTDGKHAKRLVSDGRKLTKQKRYGQAIAAFDEAIDADAGAARAWSGRGYAKLLEGKDLEGARADFEKAASLNKDRGYQSAIFYNLGLLAEKKGDDLAAVLAFSRAYELKPKDAIEKKLRQYQKKTTQRKLKKKKKAPTKKR